MMLRLSVHLNSDASMANRMNRNRKKKSVAKTHSPTMLPANNYGHYNTENQNYTKMVIIQ